MIPNLRAESEMSNQIDPLKLRKAARLPVVKVGRGQYQVGTHWVDLYNVDIPDCDCEDYLWKENVCKHKLAAMLAEGQITLPDQSPS